MSKQSLVSVATSSLNQTALDLEGNFSRIVEAIEQAKRAGASFLCLPELAVCGYGCEDEFFSVDMIRKCEDLVEKLLSYTEELFVNFGVPVIYQGQLFNCTAVAYDGKLLGVCAKKSLAREGVHYEPRWFTPWTPGHYAEFEYAGCKNVLLGDLYFKVGDVGVGLEICEEAWGVQSSLSSISGDIDLILNSSASHFAVGKNGTRVRLVTDSSRKHCAAYVYANLVGVESGRTIYDGSTFVAVNGTLAHEAQRFSLEPVNVHVCSVDLSRLRVSKLKVHSTFQVDKSKVAPRRVDVLWSDKEGIEAHLPVLGESPPPRIYSPNEELHMALILGLYEYLKKTRSKGFVVSLSGGRDSSACAYLVASMVHRVFEVFGIERAQQEFLKLGITPCSDTKAKKPSLDQAKRDYVRTMLTCIYQKTRNSSKATLNAAKKVSEALSAQFFELEIDDLVESFTKKFEDATKKKLSWENDDVALQNIQARTRSPLPWMLANTENKILLTTSNRSEMSVGYATMDGDSSGGLAPIAGVDKTFLSQWLVWAEKDCDIGIGAVKALKYVNESAPTAELRPSSEKQTDEADLMPYELLQDIERLMIGEKMGTEHITTSLSGKYPHLSVQELGQYVDKFRGMWRVNQWKRERFASSFHVFSYNLDPASGCRFPILSGS